MNFFKILGVNFILIALVVIGVFMGASFLLNSYTRHGDSLTVPDLRGLNVNDAIHLLEDKKLRFLVSDSLYFEDKPKLSVLEQNPAANSNVKEGRCIYLTINTNQIPTVAIPDVLDASYRQAEAMLKNAGLKVGNIIYKPDFAKDVVLEISHLNTKILPGTKIGKGTAIDLILGTGLTNEVVDLPNLIGLTIDEARNLLHSSSLNIGSIVALGGISDSTTAKVVRQNPAFTEGATINGGQSVDLFIKQ
ncbi:MAG: PASTA domain-containing protein [Bacteroidia bacterium]|nr:PASTA domain-containing protein [Bacteroidia bacterium]